jgi:hypothetical protein
MRAMFDISCGHSHDILCVTYLFPAIDFYGFPYCGLLLGSFFCPVIAVNMSYQNIVGQQLQFQIRINGVVTWGRKAFIHPVEFCIPNRPQRVFGDCVRPGYFLEMDEFFRI